MDTAINWGVERLGKRGSAKGMVVTGADVKKHGKAFRAYSAVYPVVWAVSQLDRAGARQRLHADRDRGTYVLALTGRVD